MTRSLIDSLLFALRLVPTNAKFRKLKQELQDIPLSKLSSILLNHRFSSFSDLNQLNKLANSFDITIKIDNIWDRLVVCGTLIDQKLFNNIDIIGPYQPTYKILQGYTYSQNFLTRFDFLWKRDKALRKLEWKLLKIGKIYNRDKIINTLSDNEIDIIANNDLIEIIKLNNSLLNASIAKSLLYKIKQDPQYHNIYENIKTWYKLDELHCLVILADSLKESGIYSTILMERYETRIKSLKID